MEDQALSSDPLTHGPLFLPSGLADLSLRSAQLRWVAYVLFDYCRGDHVWAASELRLDQSTMRRWLHGQTEFGRDLNRVRPGALWL